MSNSADGTPVATARTTEEAVADYQAKLHEFEELRRGVENFFRLRPALNQRPFPLIHSIKSRVKDPKHLAEKIRRKKERDGTIVTVDNLYSEITDLCGVRVMHLHQSQFPRIHEEIKEKVESGDWTLAEAPIAYSWDPEASEFYGNQLGFRVKIKESYYTSIHYLVKPRPDGYLCCEVQVRTLFEEAWGEIDHAINYPDKTKSVACREQLKVLAKLVSTGTRLAEAIFTVHDNEKQSNP